MERSIVYNINLYSFAYLRQESQVSDTLFKKKYFWGWPAVEKTTDGMADEGKVGC